MAADTIVITVPNREMLRESAVRCPRCRSLFSPWFHQRSFHPRDLADLFPGFELDLTAEIGPSKPRLSMPEVWIRSVFRRPTPLGSSLTCPHCGLHGEGQPPPASSPARRVGAVKTVARAARHAPELRGLTRAYPGRGRGRYGCSGAEAVLARPARAGNGPARYGSDEASDVLPAPAGLPIVCDVQHRESDDAVNGIQGPGMRIDHVDVHRILARKQRELDVRGDLVGAELKSYGQVSGVGALERHDPLTFDGRDPDSKTVSAIGSSASRLRATGRAVRWRCSKPPRPRDWSSSPTARAHVRCPPFRRLRRWMRCRRSAPDPRDPRTPDHLRRRSVHDHPPVIDQEGAIAQVLHREQV